MDGQQMSDLDLFKSEWNFSRRLTLELLDSLTDAELGETPSPNVGAYWKQFRHIGRLQECYQEALNTKKIRFDYGNKRYRGGCSKSALRAYLRALDRELLQAIDRVDWKATIDWHGEAVSVFQHLMRMVGHESLHHGQWVLYARLTRKNLPPGWKVLGI
jgi:uncharacterized damage-inducible protein DinB